jgi:hypothetical protein
MGIIQDIESAAQCVSPNTKKVYLGIAGMNCALLCRDDKFLSMLSHSSNCPGDVRYEIILVLLPDEALNLKDKPLRKPVVQRLNSGNNYIVNDKDNHILAIVNILSGKILARMPRSLYCFEVFIRALFSLILVDEKGLLLQAAALDGNKRGCIFCGPHDCISSAARMSPGQRIFSDGLVFIKRHYEAYRIYQSPFQSLYMNGCYEDKSDLQKIYFLKSDGKTSLHNMSKMQAIIELYRNTVFYSNDPQLLSMVFRNCCDLANHVLANKLNVSSETSLWTLIDTTS